MVTHIVIFKWVAGTSSERIAELRQALSQLALDLTNLASITHGPDLAFRDGNGDYGLVALFADRERWALYQAHPKHIAFVRDIVSPIQAERLTVQF